MSDPERVELDESAVDQIAERVASLLAPKAEPEESPEIKSLRDEIADLKAAKPQRSELEEGGIKPKPNEGGLFYGGYDKFSAVGDTDADRATNLYLADVMLQHVGKRLSARGREVMVKAATAGIEQAIRSPQELKVGSGAHPSIKAFLGQSRGEGVSEAYKAMTSTGANAGDEWVPTFSSSVLWTDIHLATVIANSFERVAMPTNPYTLPTLDDDVTFYAKGTENVAVTASNLNTGNATLTAATVQAEVNFSDELDEDSIIPVIPSVRANLVRRGAQTIDDLVVHGDTETGGTGNVNSDDAAPAAGSFYLSLNGLRKFAVVTNSGNTSNVAAALTSANFTTIQSLMQRYGARGSDLRLITGTATWIAMRTIAEVITQDKYGSNATVIRGELAKFFNIPILVSEAIPGTSTDKVDADGKYTTTTPSSNDTKGWLVLVNPQGWKLGFRRDLRLETFKDIQKGMNILVASFRQAQIPSGISTLHTVAGRNITV